MAPSKSIDIVAYDGSQSKPSCTHSFFQITARIWALSTNWEQLPIFCYTSVTDQEFPVGVGTNHPSPLQKVQFQTSILLSFVMSVMFGITLLGAGVLKVSLAYL